MKPISALLLTSLLLLAACTSPEPKAGEPASGESGALVKPAAPAPAPVSPPADKALLELQGGMASYENGSYKLAARQFQAALTLGLDGPGNQARAHKYLAFIHCVGGRQRQCREEFSKAIDADPAFELSPAEAGHPTWGPVFRKLKAAGKPTRK